MAASLTVNGALVREARLRREWTMVQLAEVAGVHPGAVWGVEKDHRRSLADKRAICRVLDLDPAILAPPKPPHKKSSRKKRLRPVKVRKMGRAARKPRRRSGRPPEDCPDDVRHFLEVATRLLSAMPEPRRTSLLKELYPIMYRTYSKGANRDRR